MILARTPFRISFFGGGTDYPVWYRQHGGSVLGMTIDKYCYISCRYLPPFFGYKHRIVYSQVELIKEISEIRHPAVRGVLQTLGAPNGLEIHHDGDLPARSGLGSSSAFTVGMIHALTALTGTMISKQNLAEKALHIEQNVIKEHVGSQDQVLTTYGGLNRIDFSRDDSFTVTPIILTKERILDFQNHMLLFFTGFSRISSEVAKANLENLERRKKDLLTMSAMVDEAIAILQNSNTPMDSFGRLLRRNWEHKRTLSDKVTTPAIDEIYQAGLDAGALGGKLLGAGGGGFMLFFVKPELQAKVRERLKKLICVNFRIDYTGSKIVVYEPNSFR